MWGGLRHASTLQKSIDAPADDAVGIACGLASHISLSTNSVRYRTTIPFGGSTPNSEYYLSQCARSITRIKILRAPLDRPEADPSSGAHNGEHVPAQLVVLDRGIGAEEINSVGRGQEAEQLDMSSGLVLAEKRGQRNLKDLGNLLKPAATDPIRALLIFLDLLKRDAELFAQRGLRQALRLAEATDALAYGAVGVGGGFGGHGMLTTENWYRTYHLLNRVFQADAEQANSPSCGNGGVLSATVCLTSRRRSRYATAFRPETAIDLKQLHSRFEQAYCQQWKHSWLVLGTRCHPLRPAASRFAGLFIAKVLITSCCIFRTIKIGNESLRARGSSSSSTADDLLQIYTIH